MNGLRSLDSRRTTALCAAVVISLAFGSVRADEAYHDQPDEPVVRMLDESANSWTHEFAADEPGAELSSFFVAAEEPRGAPADNAVGEANAGRRAPLAARTARPLFGDLAGWNGNERRSAAYARAASVPWMLGNSLDPTVASLSLLPFPSVFYDAPLPLAAVCRRSGLCENNKALPHDRVFFTYNHFENGVRYVDTDMMGERIPRAISLDRYTLGLETTFFDGLWSVEARMPFAGSLEYSRELLNDTIHGGHVGNLSVILKRLCYHSESLWISAGIGVEAPTGSDAYQYQVFAGGGETITIHNDAAQIMPYLGLLYAPEGRFFFQGWIELDIATNGNRIDAPLFDLSGRLYDQTVLRTDVSAGYWLWRNPDARLLSGMACLAELHYTTALQDADLMGPPPLDLGFGNLANRFDLVDLTVGLDAEVWDKTSVRVGGVFPLRSWDNRTFDAELQVQVNRRF